MSVSLREEGFSGLLGISGETGRNELLTLFFIEHGEQDCDHFTHFVKSHFTVFDERVDSIPLTCAGHGKARCAVLRDGSLVGRERCCNHAYFSLFFPIGITGPVEKSSSYSAVS